MVKAVFFDFDGVLALEGRGIDAICRGLAEEYGLSYETLAPALANYMTKMLLEPIRYESIVDKLSEDIGTQITVQDIYEAAKLATPNSEMAELANQLRANGVMTGIITDNNVERMEILRPVFNLDNFSPLIISAEVGSSKWQSTKIFETALSRAQLQPHETLFIDNTEANLRYADELGMQTYWHDHDVNDVAAFRSRLAELSLV